MAGVNVRLMSKRTLDFSGLGASQQSLLMVNMAINVAAYREGTLQVRVHATPTIGGNAQIKIALVRTAPSEEDPGMLFYASDPPLLTVTLDAATAPPSGETGILLSAPLPANIGGWLGLAAIGKQDASTETIRAVVSVDLSLKE